MSKLHTSNCIALTGKQNSFSFAAQYANGLGGHQWRSSPSRLLARVTEQSVWAHNFRVADHAAKSAFVFQSAHSVPQSDHWLFKRKLSTLNSRQALISEQDAGSVNQVLFIAKLFNQFVGKQRDFALQIRCQLAIDFSARVRR
jgi:hypothetical protein